ncbi:transferrin-binding protein-like solute binding protein [Actinobacillus equuli]|uniref:Transferrin binding protein-like solute binding protein n=1 Tax=Actinobacillus equuli TaxID=718 RepID=A0AAX3FGI9_ACTEU|nr:transferrin-binding protein-like solute binding protein [Actinobacillus equuli]AIZ79070.1 hypothetical protein ACEE_04640 [Actinobacillus equuli subsp. equuli]WGE45316.1 transferrin-binding protein-like solute binding protein [Actinobacillus equuli subsp. equuli]VEE89209.1 Transferrin binding protein-like solute binding protein [Actinobacillus equuli]
MKTLTKISLAALSMAIAACSSGGGGSKNSAPKPKVEQKQELKQGQKQQAPKSDAIQPKQPQLESLPDAIQPKQPQLESLPDVIQPKGPEPKTNMEEPKEPEPKANMEEPKEPEPKANMEEPKEPEPKTNMEEPKEPEPKTNMEEPKEPEPKANIEEPKQPELKSNNTQTVEGKGYTFTFTGRARALDFNPQSLKSENITQLVVDGQKFDVSVSSPNKSEYVILKEDGTFLSNDNIFSSIKYGIHQLTDNQWTYFVQGTPTKHSEIPQQGTFNYEGSYISYGAPVGVATFKADFGEKRLTGELKGFYPGGSSYGLGAIIEGNHFHSRRGTVNVDGHFYGKDADELAGFVEDEAENHLSIFGGKKVDSSTK